MSVRARNLKVILSVFFDEQGAFNIKEMMMGRYIEVKAQGSDLKVQVAQESSTED